MKNQIFNLTSKFYVKLFVYFLISLFIINFLFFFLPKLYDFPLTLHDPYSVYAYGLIETHNSVMWYILLILIFVYWLLVQFLRESTWNASYKKLGLFGFINASEIYSFFEYLSISIYLKIWSVFFFFWRTLSEFFFLNFFYKDFVEFYTWVEWVPDIFRHVCDFFYDDYANYFIHLGKNHKLDDVIGYFYIERKLLSTYCNHTNNYYFYSENMHHDMHLNLSFRHSGFLEFLFAFFPSLIILLILIPSLHLLYSSEDNILEPEYTIKIIGHQWYWSYEFHHIFQNADGSNIKLNFDITQNLKIESDLNKGEYRLLEVENDLKFPIGTPIRLLISSADVLHCWALPAFGIKVDAVPGRLNAINTFIFAPGTFYGQCSELCGVGHGFMPIKVQAVPVDTFLKFAGFSNLLDNSSNINNELTSNKIKFFNKGADDDYLFNYINNQFFLINNSIINDNYYVDDLNDMHLDHIFSECINSLLADKIRDLRCFMDEYNINWIKHCMLRHVCIDSVLFGYRDNLESFYDNFKNNYIPLKYFWEGLEDYDDIELPPLNHLNNLMHFLEAEIYYNNLKHLNANLLIKKLNADYFFNKLNLVKYIDLYKLKDLDHHSPIKTYDPYAYRENYINMAEANSISHLDIKRVPNDFFFKDENSLWGSIRFGSNDVSGETETFSVVISGNKIYTVFADGSSEIVEISDLKSDSYWFGKKNLLEPRKYDKDLRFKGPSDLLNLLSNNVAALKDFEKVKIYLNDSWKIIHLKHVSNVSDFDPVYIKRNLDKHLIALNAEYEALQSGAFWERFRDEN